MAIPQPALSATHYMANATVLLAGTTSGHPLRLPAPDQSYSVQSGYTTAHARQT
jgi:hypothetical protein